MSTTTVAPVQLAVDPVAPTYPVSADFADPNHDGAVGMPWRWSTVLTDIVGLFVIVVSFPFVILLVGAPIGLAFWLARLAFGAF